MCPREKRYEKELVNDHQLTTNSKEQSHKSPQAKPSVSTRMHLKAILLLTLASWQLVSGLSTKSNSTISSSVQLIEPQPLSSTRNTTSPPVAMDTNITVNKNTTKAAMVEYGGQQEASILRPLILKSLLNAKRVTAATEEQPTNEDMEEVTQTIMMPMKEEAGVTEQEQVSGDEETSAVDTSESINSSEADSGTPVIGAQSNTSLMDIQLKPEASLQLSNTEISNLLNDHDAPEIYRERENSGHGVVVGEERGQHLEASGSSFGSHQGAQLGGFGSSRSLGEPGSVDYRLAHAASGEFDNHHHHHGHQAGFSHRFGSGFEDGRMAQSPSEFGMNSYGGHPGGYSGGYGGGSFSGYSPHSGLVQAGSGDYMPHGYGHGAEGFSHGGYLGSPRLEQHSSEMYGPSHYGSSYGGVPSHGYGGGGSMYGGGEEGRLLSADSHMGGYHGGLHSPGDSMVGFHGGFEPRGYASNDVRHQANTEPPGGFEPNRLYPLSPIVPNAEEESAASANQKSQQLRPSSDLAQTHEPLNEDDITTVGSSSREDSNLQQNSASSESSNDGQEEQPANGQQQEEASLVLNVPPTSSSEAPPATIEFSRIGSAGYMAPEIRVRARALTRKTTSGGKHSSDNYDPADNPAHAGKYIID